MKESAITTKRKIQIFLTGLAPLVTLCIILSVAAQFGLDVVSLFTKVEPRDAAHYVVVTKIFGIRVYSRPATQADLVEEDTIMRTVKIAVLIGSAVIISGALLMCYAAITGKPQGVLFWCDRQLGSVRAAFPSLG